MPSLNLLLLGAVAVLFVLMMFRNGRKRARMTAELKDSLRPGAEIMTSFGVYGVVQSVDDDENKIVLKTGPTSELTIHRQAVGRVVTPPEGETAEQDAIAHNATIAASSSTIELNGERIPSASAAPSYGERVSPVVDDAARRTGDAAAGKTDRQ